MFGYVTINPDGLEPSRKARFRAFYCGLCRTLGARCGALGKATLSYDMTFLALLLNALYEPGETAGSERCALHPVHRHDYVTLAATDYAADMNLALAYHKALDDWQDDRSVAARAVGRRLKPVYDDIRRRYPGKCAAIEAWLDVIRDVEAHDPPSAIDAAANATGAMLGELFLWRGDDVWQDHLRAMGDGLGRFIYFMDAYEDLPADLRRGRYNLLKPLAASEGYEELCRSALLQMAADATDAFERLPVVMDADLIRNTLYSGIWTRYGIIQKKRNPKGKGED